MVKIASGEWIADLGGMVCRNINNGITVCFEKTGEMVTGKINDMPMELQQQWATLPDGHIQYRMLLWKRKKCFLRLMWEMLWRMVKYRNGRISLL